MRIRRPLPLLLLLLATGSCHAQDTIHRCLDRNGQPLFSDQPCASQDATPVSPPAAASARSGAVVHGICPTSLAALKQRLADTFQHRDANALASLMQWRGYDQRNALLLMQRLRSLVRQPLLGIDDGVEEGAAPAAAGTATGPTAAALPTLTLRLGPATQAFSATYAVIDRDGCLWLQP